MGKKNFLPRDVELPLMSEGPAAAMGTGVYRDTVRRPKATKTKSWVMKMFSALTFLGLIFGGTIVGFSFKMISDNQVGYYNNEPGYMGPGTYFQFPWTKEEMKIVDVGIEFLRLERLMGVLEANDQEFMIQNANVIYNVSDVDQYIQTLKNVRSPVYCQTEIENAVLGDIVAKDPEELPGLKELRDIPVPDCGMTIERAILSRPIITQKNPLPLPQQQPRVDAQEEVTTPKPPTTTKSITTPTTTTTTRWYYHQEPEPVTEEPEELPEGRQQQEPVTEEPEELPEGRQQQEPVTEEPEGEPGGRQQQEPVTEPIVEDLSNSTLSG